MRALIIVSLLALGCGQRGAYTGEPPAASAVDEAPALALAKQPATEAVDGAAGGDVPESADAMARKIIYTAELDLVVEDFNPVPALVEQLVKRYQGFIADSDVSGKSGERRRGVWKVRIPADGFGSFLQDAEGEIGELRSASRDSQDVSEEYYDVDARIRNKQQEEARLLKLLEDRTGTLDEILRIERELSRVREDIERLEGRMRMLTDLTSLTTVTLRVEEVQHYVPEVATTFGDRVRRAWENSLWSVRTAGEACVVGMVGAAPWIAVLAIPGAIAVRILRRKLFA